MNWKKISYNKLNLELITFLFNFNIFDVFFLQEIN